MSCGFIREIPTTDGRLALSDCSMWSDCPHRPVTVYDVWSVQPIRHGPDIWHYGGRFDNRTDARLAELRSNADWYSYIAAVQLCHWWPGMHPRETS